MVKVIRKKKRLSAWKIAVIVLLAAVIVVAILELTNKTHMFHQKSVPAPHTINQQTKGELPSKTDKTTASNTPGGTSTSATSPTTTPGDNKATATQPTANPNQTLLAPVGTFVSAHHVSLSTQMASDCTTTPGATCTIIFTSGTTTKTLSTQATDSGGSAYWDWHPSDAKIDLTPGTWHVQAKATLGSKVMTADDAESLVVSS